MYVFVYGSLLSPRDLRQVGIDPSKCKPAVLPGYEITFDKKSINRCAAANLSRCEGEECNAVGIVCEAGEEVINVLDRREGNYHRELVTYKLIDKNESGGEAYTYISDNRLGDDEIEKCIQDKKDKKLMKYLEIIADGLCYWDEKDKGFIELYISGIKNDKIHSKITAMLKEALRRRKQHLKLNEEGFTTCYKNDRVFRKVEEACYEANHGV
ncbi:MAG: gamma-glutamylcyclotransferase [Desulfurococcales archaeon]|nr:gamma-glutamylcyclotransferase [Desulfurococcales archaeon]